MKTVSAYIVDRLLHEHPELVPFVSFGFEDPLKAAQTVEELARRRDGRKIGAYKGVEIRRAGDIIYVVENGLAFFVQLEEASYVAAGDVPHATQIALWQKHASPVGLATYVFWTIVFPIHGTISSDEKQSVAGARFWSSRVRDAFERGLRVYLVNVETDQLLQFEDVQDFQRRSPVAYGGDARYRRFRLLITKETLTPTAGFDDTV